MAARASGRDPGSGRPGLDGEGEAQAGRCDEAVDVVGHDGVPPVSCWSRAQDDPHQERSRPAEHQHADRRFQRADHAMAVRQGSSWRHGGEARQREIQCDAKVRELAPVEMVEQGPQGDLEHVAAISTSTAVTLCAIMKKLGRDEVRGCGRTSIMC
jgi:hypothetical protein